MSLTAHKPACHKVVANCSFYWQLLLMLSGFSFTCLAYSNCVWSSCFVIDFAQPLKYQNIQYGCWWMGHHKMIQVIHHINHDCCKFIANYSFLLVSIVDVYWCLIHRSRAQNSSLKQMLSPTDFVHLVAAFLQVNVAW